MTRQGDWRRKHIKYGLCMFCCEPLFAGCPHCGRLASRTMCLYHLNSQRDRVRAQRPPTRRKCT